MRHRKSTLKLGRTSSHRRCLFANMLKSLIIEERMFTTTAKAKELKKHADRMITLAKKNTLSSRRDAIGRLMIRFNTLSSKDARLAKEAAKEKASLYFNQDRQIIEKLFAVLGPRFAARQGGYTRVIKGNNRAGDNAEMSMIEFLSE